MGGLQQYLPSYARASRRSPPPFLSSPCPPRHVQYSHVQVRLTGGLQQYLPSFLPALLGIGAPSPIDKLAVDDERHVLYALSQSGAIQVGAELGGTWEGPSRMIWEGDLGGV